MKPTETDESPQGGQPGGLRGGRVEPARRREPPAEPATLVAS
jgi:hypothetical protein